MAEATKKPCRKRQAGKRKRDETSSIVARFAEESVIGVSETEWVDKYSFDWILQNFKFYQTRGRLSFLIKKGNFAQTQVVPALEATLTCPQAILKFYRNNLPSVYSDQINNNGWISSLCSILSCYGTLNFTRLDKRYYV